MRLSLRLCFFCGSSVGASPSQWSATADGILLCDGSHENGREFQAQVGPPSNGGYFFYDAIVDGAKKRVSLEGDTPSNPVKDAGEWNTYDIRADGRGVTLRAKGIDTIASSSAI